MNQSKLLFPAFNPIKYSDFDMDKGQGKYYSKQEKQNAFRKITSICEDMIPPWM